MKISEVNPPTLPSFLPCVRHTMKLVRVFTSFNNPKKYSKICNNFFLVEVNEVIVDKREVIDKFVGGSWISVGQRFSIWGSSSGRD